MIDFLNHLHCLHMFYCRGEKDTALYGRHPPVVADRQVFVLWKTAWKSQMV